MRSLFNTLMSLLPGVQQAQEEAQASIRESKAKVEAAIAKTEEVRQQSLAAMAQTQRLREQDARDHEAAMAQFQTKV